MESRLEASESPAALWKTTRLWLRLKNILRVPSSSLRKMYIDKNDSFQAAAALFKAL